MPGLPNHPLFARKSKSNNVNNIVVSSSQGLEGFGNIITLSWERLKKLNVRFLAKEYRSNRYNLGWHHLEDEMKL